MEEVNAYTICRFYRIMPISSRGVESTTAASTGDSNECSNILFQEFMSEFIREFTITSP